MWKPLLMVTALTAAAPGATLGSAEPELPPLPAGVTPLRFGEMFAPIGRRGLAYSDKLRLLNGRRVRILGYMVSRERAPAGTLLLAPRPFVLHEREHGQADDLPATTLSVTVPDAEGEVPFTPGLLLLTGTLELGNREEADGRVSTVRLILEGRPEPSAPEQATHDDPGR